MSQHHKNKFSNPILSGFRSIRITVQRMTRQTLRSLLRVWVKINRQGRYSRAGFVLPTVTMVILVVVLLSVTIMLRSMDRAQNAQFVRASKAALEAATPAVDRANAKIKELLLNETNKDISEAALYKKLTSLQTIPKTPNDKYTFGDEEVIYIKFDVNGDGTIQPNGNATVTDTKKQGLLVTPDEDFNDNEQINTAWRFPVDTDNNGSYDSFILYGIFFRNGNAISNTKRSYLDARAEPITLGKSDPKCDFAKGKGGIQKPFFIYTVTLPIKDITNIPKITGKNYETYKGTPSYSALEYQQDWTQYFLSAVEYENDLELAPFPTFNFNGGLSTQGNLIISPFNNTLRIYQVSAKESCYYNEDLAKLKVSGNVINGMVDQVNRNNVTIDLIQGTANPISGTISTANESLDEGDNGVTKGLTNDGAYRERLLALVKLQDAKAEAEDPTSVSEEVNRRMAEDPSLTRADVRKEELSKYFKARLRKVPFAEVAVGGNATTDAAIVAESKDTLRPPDKWMFIGKNNTDPTGADFTKVKIKINQLEATNPTNKAKGTEISLGDRVLAGNNLPSLMFSNTKWVAAEAKLTGDTWKDDNSERTRTTQSKQIASVGDLKRDGYWEKTAAKKPLSIFDGVGGLRVVTGAGIYDRTNSFLPPPMWDDPTTTTVVENSPTYNDPVTTATETFPIIWPDTMPMSPGVGSKVYDNTGLYNADGSPKTPFTPSSALWVNFDAARSQGDLRMRATAVYHYAQDAFNPPTDLTQTPIACVSSYYDPSNVLTAANATAAISGADDVAKSNNGKVYGPPTTARPGAATYDATTGLFTPGPTLLGELAKQANYVFPDGRFVNEPLREALRKADTTRTLSEQSAVDTAMCGLGIMGSPLVTLGTAPTSLPDGAIQEVTLLNAREIKAVDKDDLATTVDETFTLSSPLVTGAANLDTKYQLPLEHRFPLEIRATQIDLNLLRTNTISYTETPVLDYLESGKDYMLPFSGVVYATRDDALPDRSNREESTTTADTIDEDLARELSPTDYKLDPTRRPNGILLVNGSQLGRKTSYATSEEVRREKGLTLVSNLPVYIQGDFNLHTQGEFTGDTPNVTDWPNFYTRTGLNPNFACRAGDPSRQQDGFKCDTGDEWRQANILADAVTLLSNNFKPAAATYPKFGYRNEGDFDLRNNAGNTVVGYPVDIPQKETDLGIDLNGNGTIDDATTAKALITAKAARMLNGFNPYNNFVTNGLSSGRNTNGPQVARFDINRDGALVDAGDNVITQVDANYIKKDDGNPTIDSTYFNNYVTPIQRRVKFSEYVMEICRKLPVSACKPEDWEINVDAMPYKVYNPATEKITASDKTGTAYTIIGKKADRLWSGTTDLPPLDRNDQRYPRRVAFLRKPAPGYELELAENKPIPLGIDSGGLVQCYSYADYSGCIKFTPTTAPRATRLNTLLFRTTSNIAEPNSKTSSDWSYSETAPLWYENTTYSTTDRIDHPRLVPVLQIQAPTQKVTTDFLPAIPGNADATRWLPRATNTTYNLVVAAGDVPSRPGNASNVGGETNGGLQNIVRVMENWGTPTPERNVTISGSFVQLGRSAYATAPYQSILVNSLPAKMFDSNTEVYANSSGSGRIAYFIAPGRNWGYDVGLLSQVYPEPDLFTKNFGTLDGEPNQYFREIGRDDPWVTALLCGIPSTEGNRPAGVDCSKYGG